MESIALLLLTAFSYGLYNLFIKLSSGSIHQVFGAFVLQAIATMVGGILLLYLYLSGHTLLLTHRGVSFAILGGVFVGIAEIMSFYVFARGVSLSTGMPIIIGGSIAISLLLSIVFLKESPTIVQIIGVFLIATGVVLAMR